MDKTAISAKKTAQKRGFEPSREFMGGGEENNVLKLNLCMDFCNIIWCYSIWLYKCYNIIITLQHLFILWLCGLILHWNYRRAKSAADLLAFSSLKTCKKLIPIFIIVNVFCILGNDFVLVYEKKLNKFDTGKTYILFRHQICRYFWKNGIFVCISIVSGRKYYL